jgi:CheY-like chemotaxis protein
VARRTPILVVDDEFALVEALSEVLVWEGYEVISAANGQRALEELSRAQPALILLDYMMPVMDGLQMLARLRADPVLRDLPVVMMTAGRVPQEPEGRGWDALLRKPFELEALLDLVRRFAGPPHGGAAVGSG